MKRYNSPLALMLLILVAPLSTGCSGRKENVANEKYERWNASLSDSVKNITSQIDSTRNNIEILREEVSQRLNGFTYVEKSREVEGYTILTGWQNRYPLTSTGIVARITVDEGFELIAACQGADFTQIEVQSEGRKAVSDVVPYDQALNYRAGGLNTVLFTGEKALEVARLISDNSLNNMTLVFVNGKTVSKWPIPEANKNMITDTYLLYEAQKKVEALERKLPMLNEKIRILRRTMDRHREAGSEHR